MDQHAEVIAGLVVRVDAIADDVARHERVIGKLTEAVDSLRGMIGTVATKQDVAELRADINAQFTDALRSAYNSIPSKVVMVVAIITGAVGVAGFLLHALIHA